ncbi:hypothetical protein CCACVL1_30811 [Corchorus capsularis]|uniref:Uncharacterized protein n=1 Tax=Corchorus capsularis TaxID=210143 RepID=A0A1R3FVI8_COCAP|nr:hypothetical protein CCACVL1_30811 [Corchorus capsularis]
MEVRDGSEGAQMLSSSLTGFLRCLAL